MNKIVKNTLILTAITVVAGLLLGVVYGVTKDPIAKAQEKAKQEDRERLQNTVDVGNEITNELRRKSASAVHRDLHDKWLRD